ncbi:PIG-L deacetylase family protein [Deinococcus peraridilitoris]|uniref:PIG-L deacetylase family protein n=1 Tax=Deinococcus peraridilitoris TaxID=432329 RepID=UPI0006942E05|nr:PIG-L family deacetylase [Deinococcus peraridilitoris]
MRSSSWRGGRQRAQQQLARARQREALQATGRLGIPPERVVFLGFPDRGLNALASSHYTRPYRSSSTGVDFVPYVDAYRPGAPYTGEEFVRQLGQLLSRIRPGVVLTPGPLDSHGDHRATTALVRHTLGQRPGLARPPSLLYYLVHSGPEWPFPKGFFPGFTLTLPPAYGQVRALSHALSRAQVRAKRDAIGAYASQVSVMGWNLWSFLRRNELLIPAESAVLETRLMVSTRAGR